MTWSTFHADRRDQLREQRDRARDLASHFEEEVYRLEQQVADQAHRILELEDDVSRLLGEIADAQSRHPSTGRL